MESLVTELKKLNLSEKEARIYLTLLELGPSTPYRIAKKAHLKRPTAYVIAEELVEKGLLVQAIDEKKKTYIARSPESYIENIEKSVSEAKMFLPELMAIQKRTSEQPNLLYFEGLEGLKRAYDYKLKDFHNTEIVGFAARSDHFNKEFLSKVSFPWNEYREKHNIRLKIFTSDDPKLANFKTFFANKKSLLAKFLPENLYSSDCTIEIFSWGVRIVMVQSMQAIIIESEKLSGTFRQVFNLLWQKTEGEYETPQKLKLVNIEK